MQSTTHGPVVILSRQQIEKKLKRMAYEIWEQHADDKEIVLLGIPDGGMRIAEELTVRLREISDLTVTLGTLRINKQHPLNSASVDVELHAKSLVLVDDVANSGRTLFYALQPLMQLAPERITIAVLIDRNHKQFPVSADIIGHRLATTLHEHIEVTIADSKAATAFLA